VTSTEERVPLPSESPGAPPGLLDNHLGGEDAPRYRQYQLDLIAPYCGRSVLEVGSGLGEFASQLEGPERLVLTDADSWLVERLAERYQSRPDVDVAYLALPEEVSLGHTVDTVLALNVLEHVEEDVAALHSLRSVMEPGGRLILWVPAYPALYGDFDRQVGHVRRYTPKTLRETVEAAGLHVEELRPVNLLGGFAWWLAVHLGGTGAPKPALVRLYDRLVIPATRLMERAMTPPFGQSLFCIAAVPY
jgi:SAM-dependent methyltransferase